MKFFISRNGGKYPKEERLASCQECVNYQVVGNQHLDWCEFYVAKIEDAGKKRFCRFFERRLDG